MLRLSSGVVPLGSIAFDLSILSTFLLCLLLGSIQNISLDHCLRHGRLNHGKVHFYL